MCTVIKQTGDSLDLRMWGQGERYAEILCQLVLSLYANPHIELDNVNFTEKEKEVLHMLLQGLRDDYIARALFISPKTVRNHISNMLRKVRVDSRTQLVLWALQKKKGLNGPGTPGFLFAGMQGCVAKISSRPEMGVKAGGRRPDCKAFALPEAAQGTEPGFVAVAGTVQPGVWRRGEDYGCRPPPGRGAGGGDGTAGGLAHRSPAHGV